MCFFRTSVMLISFHSQSWKGGSSAAIFPWALLGSKRGIAEHTGYRHDLLWTRFVLRPSTDSICRKQRNLIHFLVNVDWTIGRRFLHKMTQTHLFLHAIDSKLWMKVFVACFDAGFMFPRAGRHKHMCRNFTHIFPPNSKKQLQMKWTTTLANIQVVKSTISPRLARFVANFLILRLLKHILHTFSQTLAHTPKRWVNTQQTSRTNKHAIQIPLHIEFGWWASSFLNMGCCSWMIRQLIEQAQKPETGARERMRDPLSKMRTQRGLGGIMKSTTDVIQHKANIKTSHHKGHHKAHQKAHLTAHLTAHR